MIVQTNRIPKGFDALTAWPFILVRPGKEADAALIAHEEVHYREQRWITPFWWLAYGLSKRFRLAAEVRAYAVQVQHPQGITATRAATLLTQYRTGVTHQRALTLLADATGL